LLLRASGVTQNREYDLSAVTGAVEGDAGVPHSRLLVDFAEAVLGGDEAALTRARVALSEAIGPAGLADAAVDRVANATGIPLEAEKTAASADFRAALGVDRFDVAARV